MLGAFPFVPPQTFVVTNTDDDGPGSLRQAITSANNTLLTVDRIRFNGDPVLGAPARDRISSTPAPTRSPADGPADLYRGRVGLRARRQQPHDLGRRNRSHFQYDGGRHRRDDFSFADMTLSGGFGGTADAGALLIGDETVNLARMLLSATARTPRAGRSP